MAEVYDLIVIGAGPGGYVAAIKAAQLGKRVAIVEDRDIGGTCLNRGCIPTKAMLHTAEVLRELRHSDTLGIKVEGVSVDTAALNTHKDSVVEQLRTGVENLLSANKVDILRGRGTITAPGNVTVGGENYRSENILIATGSIPAMPPVPGCDLPGVVTSDHLLAAGDQPLFPRLCIVGGGVIGVEFATVYEALGCQVTIVEYQSRILPMMDREISQSLSMSLKKRGIAIHTGAALEEIARGDSELICRVRIKDTLTEIPVDGVLMATGRRAFTQGLLADGLELNLEGGQIPVDEDFATCIPRVYAIGDVTKGSIQLAHAASAQGINAVCGMFGAPLPHNLGAIPSCIYTQPEIATVGLTEAEAKEQGIPVKTGKHPMSANGKSLIVQAERGFVKLVFQEDTDVLLGAQLYCERATDMISGLVTAVANGTTREELGRTVFPHPTFCEGIGEAAEDAAGHSIHNMPKRR